MTMRIAFALVGLCLTASQVDAGQARRAPAKPAPPPPPTKEAAQMTCPTPLGVGVSTKVTYCDVLIGRDPGAGILIAIPPHVDFITAAAFPSIPSSAIPARSCARRFASANTANRGRGSVRNIRTSPGMSMIWRSSSRATPNRATTSPRSIRSTPASRGRGSRAPGNRSRQTSRQSGPGYVAAGAAFCHSASLVRRETKRHRGGASVHRRGRADPRFVPRAGLLVWSRPTP